MLREYLKAPEVTRERLYLEAVESVLANSSKILMGVEGGNNLLYLPLDQLTARHRREPAADFPGGTTGAPRPSPDGDTRGRQSRDNFRSGRSR